MIVAVAIRFQRTIWSLPKPNRHHDVRNMIVAKTGVQFVDVPLEDEGFLDENGRYYNRKQARIHAELNGQLKGAKNIGGMFTSEDLW